MRARKRLFSLAAVGAAMTVLISSGIASGDPGPPSSPPAQQVGEAEQLSTADAEFFIKQSLRLRSRLGLRSDQEYIESLVVNGVDPLRGEEVVPASQSGWWIPMTRSEEDFIQNTVDLAAKWNPELQRIFSEDPEAGFAGSYANYHKGKVTVRAVNMGYVQQRLAGIPGAQEALEFIPAKNSLKELSVSRERVKALMDEGLAAKNPVIMSTGTDVVGNTLNVGLKDPVKDRSAKLSTAVDRCRQR